LWAATGVTSPGTIRTPSAPPSPEGVQEAERPVGQQGRRGDPSMPRVLPVSNGMSTASPASVGWRAAAAHHHGCPLRTAECGRTPFSTITGQPAGRASGYLVGRAAGRSDDTPVVRGRLLRARAAVETADRGGSGQYDGRFAARCVPTVPDRGGLDAGPPRRHGWHRGALWRGDSAAERFADRYHAGASATPIKLLANTC